MSWELVVKDRFSSAHFLEHYKGKCEKMHGHTFEVEVYIKAEELDQSGIGIDFTIIKSYLKEIHLYHKIKEKYPVSRVMVWESENAGALYTEDQ